MGFDILDQILAIFLAALAAGLRRTPNLFPRDSGRVCLDRLVYAALGDAPWRGKRPERRDDDARFPLACGTGYRLASPPWASPPLIPLPSLAPAWEARARVAAFLVPSQVWGLGWEAAAPQLAFARRFSGIGGLVWPLSDSHCLRQRLGDCPGLWRHGPVHYAGPDRIPLGPDAQCST